MLCTQSLVLLQICISDYMKWPVILFVVYFYINSLKNNGWWRKGQLQHHDQHENLKICRPRLSNVNGRQIYIHEMYLSFPHFYSLAWTICKIVFIKTDLKSFFVGFVCAGDTILIWVPAITRTDLCANFPASESEYTEHVASGLFWADVMQHCNCPKPWAVNERIKHYVSYSLPVVFHHTDTRRIFPAFIFLQSNFTTSLWHGRYVSKYSISGLTANNETVLTVTTLWLSQERPHCLLIKFCMSISRKTSTNFYSAPYVFRPLHVGGTHSVSPRRWISTCQR